MVDQVNARRKAVLVTGASSGIGRAIAVQAAEVGWDVAVHYGSDQAGAEETATRVRALGGRAAIFQADMADAFAVAQLFANVDAIFPQLDALVNNAGVTSQKGKVDSYDVARVTRAFTINAISPMLCAAEAVRRMARSSGGAGGVILNIGSIAARIGGANEYVDYAASKAAIDTMTLGLSNEVLSEGIRVVCLRPGITDTAIHGRGGQPDRAERLAHLIPMGRAGQPDEVARMAVFLLSDQASYISGTVIDVAGGR